MGLFKRSPLLKAGRIEDEDRAFFRDNPQRRYRMRHPFEHELAEVKRQGQHRPMPPGKRRVVLVQHLPNGAMHVSIVGMWISPGEALPSKDAEIEAVLSGLKGAA